MKKMQGMLTGMMLGASAVTLYTMMNGRTQHRIHRYAANAGRHIADLAGDLFGR